MSDDTANSASSAPEILLPYEEVQHSKALSTALDSLSGEISTRAKSAFIAVADEIQRWDHTQIWESPNAPYAQRFRDSLASLNNVLKEDTQGSSADPGLTEARSKLKAFEQGLNAFDRRIERLKDLDMFQRAEYASRIMMRFIDYRIAEPLSDQLLEEAIELYESCRTPTKIQRTMGSVSRRTTWRDNMQDLHTALDPTQSSEDQEALRAACKSLDVLATAADEIELDIRETDLLREAVTELVDDVSSRRHRRRGD